MRYTSTRIMLCAAVATAVLAVASMLASELFGFYGLLLAAAVTFVAGLYSVARQRRNVTLFFACVAATGFVASAIAYCRIWGLAFVEGPTSVSDHADQQTDQYLFVALGCLGLMMLLLLLGSLWPPRRARRRPAAPAGKAPGRAVGRATGQSAPVRAVGRPAPVRTSSGRKSQARGTSK